MEEILVKKLLSVVVLFLGAQAHAGFFAEPYLGFDSTSTTAKTTSGVTASASNSGLTYGARLGYRLQTFWFAAEYAGGSGQDKGTTTTSDYSKAAVEAVVGYDLGRYNIWAGYGFSDKITISGTPDVYTSGTNLKIGVGYEQANHIATNLEFIMPTYTKAGNDTTESDLSATYSSYTVTSIMLSISFPFGKDK